MTSPPAMACSKVCWLFAIFLLCAVTGSAPGQTSHVQYSATSDVFPNPERGMYKGFDRASEDRPLNATLILPYRAENVTLLNTVYYLDAFRNSDISSTELALLQSDFAALRTAGMKSILRFAYTRAMSDTTDPDASLPIVLRHLDQLKPVLQANSDVIAVLQAGFIGAWGEWHSSVNGLDTSETARKAIVEKELGTLPSDRMIQLRRIRFKQAIFGTTPLASSEAYSKADASRVGFHDDGLLASWDSAGMYYLTGSASDTSKTKPYLHLESRYVPVGGEAFSLSSLITCTSAVGEMTRMHWSYLHRDWQPDAMNYFIANGCFQEMDRQLGYRFSLETSDITSSARPGNAFSLAFTIRNSGWASLYNPRKIEIILRSAADNSAYSVTLPDDPRFWEPGTASTLSTVVGIPAWLPAGSYSVLLNLPDPAPSLHDKPTYSIRLANTGTWEPTTGYNDLLTQLVVDPQAADQPYSGTLFFKPVSGDPPPPPNSPEGAFPANGAIHVTNDVTLRWHPAAGATSYRVQVSDDSLFTPLFLDRSGVMDTTQQVVGLGSNRIYFWRVLSSGPTGSSSFSSAWRFTTDTRPAPSGTFMLSPDTLQSGGGNVTLTWTSSNTDSARIDQGVGRVALQGSTTVSVNASTTFTLTLLGAGERTYQRGVFVRATTPLPDPPRLLTPANEAIRVPTSTTLSWRSVTSASSYRVQVSDDSLFATLILDRSGIADTTQQVSGLRNNRIYFWRVQSAGLTGSSSFSSPWRFTTEPRLDPTGTFSLSPDTLQSGGGTITLSWTSANADSVRIDHGIGSVAPQGSTTTTVTQSSTFTLTLFGASEVLFQRSVFVRGVQPPPDPPLLLAPANNAIQVPTSTELAWKGVAAASAYIIQVSNDSLFTSFVLADSTHGDTTLALGGLKNSRTYFWRLRTRSLSGESSFSPPWKFTTIPLPAPTGSFSVTPGSLAPGGGIVTLSWSSNNADSAKIDQGIGTVALQGSTGVTVAQSTTFTLTLFGSSSTVYHASVQVGTAPPPPAPPTSGEASVSGGSQPGSMTLRWDSVTGADSYRLQVARDSMFNTVILDDSALTTTTRNVQNLNPGNAYWWHVQGRSLAVVGPYSATWHFTVPQIPLPAGTLTVTPTMLPRGGGNVTVSWSSTGADSVLLDSTAVGPSGSRSYEISTSILIHLILKNSAGVRVLSSQAFVPMAGSQTTDDITTLGTPAAFVNTPAHVATLPRIGDGISPALNDTSLAYQFSSYTDGAARGSDWVGYTFPASQVFGGLLFQQGVRTPEGGWFSDLQVQVHSAAGWRDVSNLVSLPPYDASSTQNYQSFHLSFPATPGDGIRIVGVPGGTSHYVSVAELRVLKTDTVVTPHPVIPRDFSVDQNYPNPFNPSTNIIMRLPADADVQVVVYNILGQEVDRLVQGRLTAGIHTVVFDGSRLANGVYMYVVKMNSFVEVGKMVLCR